MLALHQRGRSTRGSLLYSYGFRFSLPLQRGWTHPKSCSLPCHHPPQTLSCHSSYTAPSGCFYQTQNSGVGTQGYDISDVGIEAYFIAAITVCCSELAQELNDCNENVTLETSGWFLQPTRLSPKTIKWFILFKTTNIKSCPSTCRQLANVNIIPLSVSHFVRQSKEKRKKSW